MVMDGCFIIGDGEEREDFCVCFGGEQLFAIVAILDLIQWGILLVCGRKLWMLFWLWFER